MTKEDKIKQSYGEHWEIVKDYVDENGWIKDDKKALRYHLVYEVFKDKMDIEITSFSPKVRLKSLQGIENNNGWINIESEDDLPKQTNNLWLLANDGSLILGKWCIFQKIFKTTSGNNFDTDGVFFTHYQPIIKPDLPLT